MEYNDMNWILLAHNTEQWWTVLEMVTNLTVP
jgi:hypothetical protein